MFVLATRPTAFRSRFSVCAAVPRASVRLRVACCMFACCMSERCMSERCMSERCMSACCMSACCMFAGYVLRVFSPEGRRPAAYRPCARARASSCRASGTPAPRISLSAHWSVRACERACARVCCAVRKRERARALRSSRARRAYLCDKRMSLVAHLAAEDRGQRAGSQLPLAPSSSRRLTRLSTRADAQPDSI